MDKLVTAQEIADLLNVADRNVIHIWRRRHADFPQPAVDKNQTVMLWYWPEVEAWAKATDRWPVKLDE